MREGWSGDDYLILLDESEAEEISTRLSIDAVLPGHRIIGLRGWDDFIVQNPTGKSFTIPTVPMAPQYLQEFVFSPAIQLQEDLQLTGKRKWYTTPIVFGGDPSSTDNISWVSHKQHIDLILWWNEQYRRSVTSSNAD
jgi:hypothetical protein